MAQARTTGGRFAGGSAKGGFAIQVLGDEQAIAYLRTVEEGCRAAGSSNISVGSNLPYPYGIEFGHRRSGRLARRAGGAFMFRGGLEQIGGQADDWLAQGIEHGRAGVRDAQHKIGQAWVAAAIPLTPVVSGRLRASERYSVGGR